MAHAGDDFNKRWREASQRVRRAEDKLGQAWSDFAAGRGGPPPSELIEEVSRLRRECDKELSALLVSIEAIRKGGPERPG